MSGSEFTIVAIMVSVVVSMGASIYVLSTMNEDDNKSGGSGGSTVVLDENGYVRLK
jgi:hypothetical protein